MGDSTTPSQPDHRTDAHALPKGTRLAEFEILGVLGLGGFGIVYLALDHSLQRQVAIKEYLPGSLAHRDGTRNIVPHSEQQRETFDAGLASFIQEARLLAQFDHFALVKVFRFWEANGTAYMATAYYEGVTLKRAYAGTRPGQQEIEHLVAPLLEAVEVMHCANCYHRDIAPDNVMVQPGGIPVLLDFGAARRVIGEMTQALTVVLKSGYAPLEQYAEDTPQAQGPWTDVYALAAMIHWMIRGKAPPPAIARTMGDSYLPLAREAPAGFDKRFLAGVDRALAMKPGERPQNIAELRTALGMPASTPATATRSFTAIQDNEETVLAPHPRDVQRARERRRHFAVFGAIVAAACVLTVLVMLNALGPIAPEVKQVAEAPKAVVLPKAVAAPEVVPVPPAEPPPIVAPSPAPAVAAKAPEAPAKPAPAVALPSPPKPAVSADASARVRSSPALAPGASPSQPPVQLAKTSPGSSRATGTTPGPTNAAEQFERGVDYELGRNGFSVDYSEAAKWFRLAAEQGHAGAQGGIGYAYRVGRGVPLDYAEARKWLEKGAANGNVIAMNNLGLMYRDGQGVARDYATAVQYFRRSADGGYHWGQLNLGGMMESGLATPHRDPAAAAEFYRKSAAGGNSQAMYNLARLHERGDGVSKDMVEAVKWFRAAAAKGHKDAVLRVAQIDASQPPPSSTTSTVAKAAPISPLASNLTPRASADQFELGLDHYDGRKGRPIDRGEAAKWFRLAADQGHAAAQNLLGHMYRSGQGVATDYSEARKWLDKSVANGNVDAISNIGLLYQFGQGVVQNDVLAVQHFRKAANAGSAWGMHNLGWMMENGRGVFRDPSAAAEMYRKSANAGNTTAMFRLARLYERGEGVKKDDSEALRWFRMAATGGHKEAAQRVAQLDAGKK